MLCPLIEIEPHRRRPDRPRRLRLGHRHERERRRRARAAAGGKLPRIAAIGEATAEALADARAARPTSSRPSRIAGGPARGAAAAGRARALRRRRRGPGGCSSTSSPRTFVPLYRTVELHAARRPTGDLVLLASPSAARAWARLGARLPVVTIGPQTTAAARAAGLDVVGEAQHAGRRGPRRLPPRSGALHHVPDRLRPAGRLRRHLSRRDEADRARRRDHRHHARHRAAGRAAGRARRSRTRCRTCRTACISRSSIRASAARGARSRCATATGRALRRARQRPAHARGRALGGDRRGARAREPRVRARLGLAHVPRPRSLLAGGGAPRARGAARRARAADRPGRARRGSTCPQPEVGTARIHCDRALDRPVRERRRSTSTATHLDAGGDRARARGSSCRSARERYYAVAARTFADARPGDIILYEDAYRNISIAISGGNAAGDVRHLGGAGHSHSPGRVVNRRVLGQKFARLATNAVLRSPRLWRVVPPASCASSSTRSRDAGTRCARQITSRRSSAALAAVEPAPVAARSTSAPERVRARLQSPVAFPSAEVVGADLADAMLAEASRKTPRSSRERVRFEHGRRVRASVSGRRRSSSWRTRT